VYHYYQKFNEQNTHENMGFVTAIEKQYNQDIKNTSASQLKKKRRMTQKSKRMKKKICTQTSQNGVTKKCSI